MMKLFKIFLMTLMFSAFWGLEANAQDFVYKPKNPAFGGDTFNHQWLISSAKLQNPYEEEQSFDMRGEQNELDRFSERLRSQLLSSISRNLYGNNPFGEKGLQEGMYEFGDFVVNVTPTEGGMMVEIFDTSSGGQTVVQIPNTEY